VTAPDTQNRSTGSTACSVVIAAHNAAGTLGAQLDALADQVGDLELEVIVVANRCSDGTVELVESYQRTGQFPHQLRVIRADRRAAATYARNRGVEAASHQWILVCDADDVVWPTWARELSSSLRDGDMVSGALALWNPNSYPDPTTMRGFEIEVPDDVRYDFLPAVVGANHAFRRSIWATIGGYDEDFVNATDIDFAWRAQLAGGKLVCNDQATVYYRDRPTLRGIYGRERAYGRAEAQLYRKFHRHGMPKPRRLRRRPSVRWAHQLATTYRLLTPGGRRVWIAHLGKNLGRLEGSLKHRVAYL
jgi:glycosyltransferase involved in cell wall biosynthesis